MEVDTPPLLAAQMSFHSSGDIHPVRPRPCSRHVNREVMVVAGSYPPKHPFTLTSGHFSWAASWA